MPSVREKTRVDTKGERDYKGLQRVGVALPALDNSSPASFRERNEYLASHCSLIVMEKRQFMTDQPKLDVKEKTEEST